MSYKNVFIENSASLSVKDSQLIINTKEIENYSVSFEDTNTLMLESNSIVLNSYVLKMLAQSKICTFVCDERHLPCGVLLPVNQHSRHLKMLQSQINMPSTFKNELWQDIVYNKITNQAECLKLNNLKGADDLNEIASCVCLGDNTHMEAKSAAAYFRYLWGFNFARNDDIWVNSALNYGYSIIRGIIARTIYSYGYEPSLGINHHSELNAFNLADDLIEPFRPFVDNFIFNISKDKVDPTLSSVDKKKIFSMLNYLIQIENRHYNVSNAIEQYIISFNQSITSGKRMLKKVNIIMLKEYNYE